MKKISVEKPSFPEFTFDQLLDTKDREQWQVLCGDENHWRLGIYSPEMTKEDDIDELEFHNCPEMFILIKGNISLLLYHEKIKKFETIKLEQRKPIVIQTWHDGFCPGGPFTGQALVIERDQFETFYQKKEIFSNRI